MDGHMGLRLTPAGRLRWEPSGDEAAPDAPPSLQGAFETDWREALFTLAADKTPTGDMPSVRYWQQLAERHLTGLCHVPENAGSFEVEPLSSADCARWILTAPPMHGGEYLSEQTLQRVWEGLDGWVRETVPRPGGLAAFLRERAPKWRQVGRVCFRLAENRNDEARPFAFMATYASGFGAAGRVKHLPLRKALEQYAGARNRAALVKLLSPVQRARRVLRLGEGPGGLRRRLPAHGVDGGTGISVAAQCAGPRGERAVGQSAELVAPAAPAPGVGDDRCRGAVEA